MTIEWREHLEPNSKLGESSMYDVSCYTCLPEPRPTIPNPAGPKFLADKLDRSIAEAIAIEHEKYFGVDHHIVIARHILDMGGKVII
jgi:hypothetical protein